MNRIRISVVALALLAAVAGALLAPAHGTLAAHEGLCFTEYQNIVAGTSSYNLIVGAGQIDGTNGNDLIIGSAGADQIDGSNGDDLICGRGGADFVSGRNGNDRLLGDVCDGCEAIPGAGPNGMPGNDSVEGRNGDDTLWGDEGNDNLAGGNGNDRFFGGNPGGDVDEIDTCNGESGTDTATRCDSTPKVP
jgi:Ca2+-binding RTX toxin-like protein